MYGQVEVVDGLDKDIPAQPIVLRDRLQFNHLFILSYRLVRVRPNDSVRWDDGRRCSNGDAEGDLKVRLSESKKLGLT